MADPLPSLSREDSVLLPSRSREDSVLLPSRSREGLGEGLSTSPALTRTDLPSPDPSRAREGRSFP